MKIKYILFMLFSMPAFADTLVLKNGKTLENVRTRLLKEGVTVTSADGKVMNFAKTEIKSIRFRPVVVKTNDKKELEQERIRIADTLTESSEWEIDPSLKPKVAVISFQAGKGVTEAEAETILELISTGFVKTKLFLVVDKLTLDQTAKELNCSPRDCSDAIVKKVKASKVVSGSITKVGNKYFINGNIIDPVKDNIDFAETAVADSTAGFQSASELFAKKAAGGISDYTDLVIGQKGGENKYEALVRSAVLPGWGQYNYGVKNGSSWHKNKGIAVGSLFAVSLLHLAYRNGEYSKARKDFDSVHRTFLIIPFGSPAEILYFAKDKSEYSQLKKATGDVQNAALLVGLVYVLNLTDSFFTGKRFLGFGNMEKKTGFQLNAYPAMAAGTASNLQKTMEMNYEISYYHNF
ncbi:MAG TPA: hypothetical protein PK453_24365 [Leptospiraceae bacterium]|nr:hypothetical protein [Leptospiraceae bacterium]HNF16811.1 hypothetical protein [Leptospiraceae bacterium]HNF27618.1 hypothetical protein [Leptospiraceae bacterium]HNI96646.1 hypothetical protein [Leptospiraceae bacterium]